MVGWHLLLLLVVEMALYGAIGRHMHVARGWSAGQAIALAAGIYLGVRVVLVAAEFIVARWNGSPIPDSLRVSFPRLIWMYLRELAGWLLMFTFVMPFVPARRSVIDRPAGGDASRPPVLLVHGLACNRGNWFWFRQQLERLGHQVYSMDYTPPVSRIARYAPQLARAVDAIVASTGATTVVLIGHSQGGLVIRAYLDQFGDDKVEQVITLGSPHRGTWLARLGLGPNVSDLREDSAWIGGLGEREKRLGADVYRMFTCIFTYHDNLVSPQLNAVLPESTAVALSGIGHLSLALSPRVVKHVASALGTRIEV